MPYALDTAQVLAEQSVATFFQTCEGDWCSKRRYYTLKSGDVQEVVSYLNIRFLASSNEALQQLHQLHELPDSMPLVCGAQVTWESNYVHTGRKPVEGSTLFGVRGGNAVSRSRFFHREAGYR